MLGDFERGQRREIEPCHIEFCIRRFDGMSLAVLVVFSILRQMSFTSIGLVDITSLFHG